MKFAVIKTPDLDWDNRKNFITTSIESGIDYIIDEGDVDLIHSLGSVNLISSNEKSDVVLIDDIKNIANLKSNNKKIAFYVEINDKNDENFARDVGKIVDYLIIKSNNWKVIPLENIIADLQDEDVKLVVSIKNLDEAKLTLETMEHGADGIMMEVESFDDIKNISNFIQENLNEDYLLKEVTITKVSNLGLGDRVCVDTCSIMKPGEGMLIGSYSKGLFLVQSESMDSEYVASRPFRVNAGPVHAYTLTPSKKTRYLSELESGEEVLIVDETGKSKKAVVGRVKIERRPLILIEAEYDNIKIKTILQNAETIRLINNKNEAISVTSLKKGDKVLAFLDDKARHFGMKIEETIIEK